MVHIYFNPQGPRGPRLIGVVCIYPDSLFQSTRPSRASTTSYRLLLMRCLFQSTRPSRASTPLRSNNCPWLFISIHKALAGLDYDLPLVFLKDWISIHKALAGLDACNSGAQVTHLDFNPQGPRGPRHVCVGTFPFDVGISIHKALAGLDISSGPANSSSSSFQSTRPSRASTADAWRHEKIVHISIHKALAGLDFVLKACRFVRIDFNPQGPRGPRRSPVPSVHFPTDFNPQGPRGPRHNHHSFCASVRGFQSTRPSRASTALRDAILAFKSISIHKALAGLDK